MTAQDDDETLAAAVSGLRTLVTTGVVPAEHLIELEQALFCDELVPRLGNLRAFRRHMATATGPGVYVELDFDFPHRHDEGVRTKQELKEDAERAAGAAVRRAVDEVLGADHRHAWHLSSPRFAVFAATHDLGTAVGARVVAHVADLAPIEGQQLGVKVRTVDAAVARAPVAERG